MYYRIVDFRLSFLSFTHSFSLLNDYLIKLNILDRQIYKKNIRIIYPELLVCIDWMKTQEIKNKKIFNDAVSNQLIRNFYVVLFMIIDRQQKYINEIFFERIWLASLFFFSISTIANYTVHVLFLDYDYRLNYCLVSRNNFQDSNWFLLWNNHRFLHWCQS